MMKLRAFSRTNIFMWLAAAAAASASLASCSDDLINDPNALPELPGHVEGIAFGLVGDGWAPDQPSRSDDPQGLAGDSASNAMNLRLMCREQPDFTLPMTVEHHRRPAPAVAETPDASSRGADLVMDPADIKDFIFNGFLKRNDDYILYMQRVKATRQGSENIFTTNPVYYWPEQTGDKMEFICLSPADIVKLNATPQELADSGFVDKISDGQGFTYTVPTLPSRQRDLMFARSGELDCATQKDQRVALRFEHLLTKVTFKLGSTIQPGNLKSITLSGISRKGTFKEFNRNDGSGDTEGHWEASAADTCSFVINPQLVVNDNGDNTVSATLDGQAITPGASNAVLNPGEMSLLMMPQNLGEHAKIVVEYWDDDYIYYDADHRTVNPDGSITYEHARRLRYLETSIRYGRWIKGEEFVYTIGVSGVTTPDFPVVIGPGDAAYTIMTIPVSATPETEWYLWIDGANTGSHETGVDKSNPDNTKTIHYADYAHLRSETGEGIGTDMKGVDTGLTEYGKNGYWIVQDAGGVETTNAQGEVVSTTWGSNMVGPLSNKHTAYVYLEENLSGYTRIIPVYLGVREEGQDTIVRKSVTYLRQVSAFEPAGQDFYVSRSTSDAQYIFGYDWTRKVTWGLGNTSGKSGFTRNMGWSGSTYGPTAGFFGESWTAQKCHIFDTYTSFSNMILWGWGAVGHFYADDNYSSGGMHPNHLTHVFDDQTFIQTYNSAPSNSTSATRFFTVTADYSILNPLSEKVNAPASAFPTYRTITLNGVVCPYTVSGSRHDFPFIWKDVEVSQSNGYLNTQSLYLFLASTRQPALKEFISGKIFSNLATSGFVHPWTYTNPAYVWPQNHGDNPITTNPQTDLGDDPSDTAVREAIKLNKFHYRDITWNTLRNMEGTGGNDIGFPTIWNYDVMMQVLELCDNDPKWYLPAPGQFKAMAADWKEAPMTGTYWTSMPVGVGHGTTSSQWGAWYYNADADNGSVKTGNCTEAHGPGTRNVKRKIRCCRVKDTSASGSPRHRPLILRRR